MTNAQAKFWKNKKVLITGYEGFLGSHLTKTLLNCGARIWGIDIRTHRKGTILSPKDLKKIKITRGNVANFAQTLRLIRDNKIEFIFHLAAEALVGKCLKRPLKAFSSNIKGTWNILEAAKNISTVRAIIISSSDKAYGIHSELPYKESAPLAGCHPYDVSKSCADLLSSTYYHTYGLPVCVTRCGNIFGPGDFNFSRIIPDAIRSALQNKALIIRSDGKFTRDYIYIEDIVNGYLLLAQKAERLNLFGQAFNFSNGTPVSVLGLVKVISRLAGREKPSYRIANQAKYEIRHQYLSAKKARKVLGWRPRFTLKTGLKRAIDWYKAHA